jgi:phospholipid-binding lipoprotein MlaA
MPSSPTLKPFGSLLAVALLAACGGNGGVRDAAPDASLVAPAANEVAPAAPAADTRPTPAERPGTATAIGPDAIVADDSISAADAPQASIDTQADDTPTQGPTQEELDYAAIYGGEVYDPVADPTLPAPAQMPVSYDPWENWNRKVHGFNNAVDRSIARPLAKAYEAVVPRPVRLGVSNFFNNLGQPVTAVNALLQGKPKAAGQAMGRFLLNSTLGIGGIFDPASDADLPRHNEDFGQTLGVWGWKTSRYVELPLFGPRTLRDSFGLIGDAPLSPTRQVGDDRTRFFLQGLQLVDVRTQLFAVDAMRQGATDEYALVRDAWLQRRNYQIHGDRRRAADEGLPDYLLDEDTMPTVPVDVMPVVPLSPVP